MDNNRRTFLGWLAALCGFSLATRLPAATPVVPAKKGFLCVYINVGGLPPHNAG